MERSLHLMSFHRASFLFKTSRLSNRGSEHCAELKVFQQMWDWWCDPSSSQITRCKHIDKQHPPSYICWAPTHIDFHIQHGAQYMQIGWEDAIRSKEICWVGATQLRLQLNNYWIFQIVPEPILTQPSVQMWWMIPFFQVKEKKYTRSNSLLKEVHW